MQNFECYLDWAEGINLRVAELSIGEWRNGHSLLKTTTLLADDRSPQGYFPQAIPRGWKLSIAASSKLLNAGCIQRIFSDKVKDECIS
jgi:hypothetical protein